jgi:hypothetical protein
VDSFCQTRVNIIRHFLRLSLYDHANSAVVCSVASSFDVFYERLFCVNQLYDLHCFANKNTMLGITHCFLFIYLFWCNAIILFDPIITIRSDIRLKRIDPNMFSVFSFSFYIFLTLNVFFFRFTIFAFKISKSFF